MMHYWNESKMSFRSYWNLNRDGKCLMGKYERIIYWSDDDEKWIETAKEIGREIPEHRGRLLYA